MTLWSSTADEATLKSSSDSAARDKQIFRPELIFNWRVFSHGVCPRFFLLSLIGNGLSPINTLSHTVTGPNFCSLQPWSDGFTPQTVPQSEVGQPVTPI